MLVVIIFMGLGNIGYASTDSDPITNSMQIGSGEGYPGDLVDIPVYMTPETLINGYVLIFQYDSNSLELVNDNKITNELGTISEEGGFESYFLQGGLIDIRANPVLISENDTKVFTLHFKIKESAQPGIVQFNVPEKALTEGTTTAQTTVNSGGITIKPKNLGHTVTFDSQSGSTVETLTNVVSGSTILAPSAPSLGGHAFAGWYKDVAGTQVWNFDTDTVTSDLTLYAKWEGSVARVKIGEVSGAPGSIVEVPVAVTESNMGIAGYRVRIVYNVQALEITKITGNAGDDFSSNYNNDNGTIVASWKDKNGGDTPIVSGDKLFTIGVKIKEQAQLGNQYLVFDSIDDEDIRLTDSQNNIIQGFFNYGNVIVIEGAQQHTVSFDSQGGTEVANLTNVNSGTTITPPSAPTKEMYTFVGWYKDKAGTESWNFLTDTVTSDVTLYAKWEMNFARIYFNNVNGTPGSTVEVPVSVMHSNLGIGAYQFKIDYDPESLEVTKVTGNSGDEFSSNYNNNGGWIRVAWADSDGGDTPIFEREKLFTISFKIKDEATLGDKTLRFDYTTSDNNLLFDSFNNRMEGYFYNGKVAVVEGSTQHTVSFNSQGGSEVASLTNVSSGGTITAPQAPTKEGYTFAGWYKDIEWESVWNFAEDKVTSDVTLYAKWTKNSTTNPTNPTNPSSPGNPNSSTGSTGSGGSPTVPNPATGEKPIGFKVIIDGVVKEQVATGSITKEHGNSVLTATVDPSKLADQLKQAANKSSVIVPVADSMNKVSVILTGEAVKNMESKQAVLEVQTTSGNYKLPAGEIAIDNVSSKLGQQVNLSDIVIHVDIAESEKSISAQADAAASKGSFTALAPPVNFSVTAFYNGKSVSVEKFSSYVVRELPLPTDIDPSKVTTAAIINPDGSVRHVPTFITNRDGKYYAVVNSLTNSDYFLIWNPKTFVDVEGHWSKQAVNDMGSRLIIKGTDETNFQPNATITRAELAAIMIRALGLSESGNGSKFTDVNASDWYAGAVAKAVEYGLIEGYNNGTFAPNQSITRQEALVILTRAIKIAGLETDGANVESLLSKFADQAEVASWAKQAMAVGVKHNLVEGSAEGLRPAEKLTRAETAAIVQRFLVKAQLIDNKHGSN
ncbi:InlB B-repeat-containing protein [Paenibacillus turicensis]|nr:InlB B-repeat-containing protein [Paenibacillus turicensis]